MVGSENDPLPPLHKSDVKLVPDATLPDPLKLKSIGFVWQVSAFAPAFINALGPMETRYDGVVAEHPLDIILSVSLTIPVPVFPQSTVMEFVPAPETIAPPVTDQAYELPPTKVVK